MAKKPVGTMVVSLDLETAAYTKAQQKILAESKEAASTINANFQRLGVTSDQIYAAMATRAELAFRKIGLSAKSSLAEVERSYAAMVTTINAANQQMANNPLFETLGIRSHAAIEAQKAAVIASFEAIKVIGFKNDQERLAVEAATNVKLIALNNELNAVQIANDAKRLASATATAEKIRAQGLMQIDAAEMNAKRTRTLQEEKAAGIMTEREWQSKMEATKAEAWAENAKRTRSQGLMQIEATKETARITQEAADKNYTTLGMKSAADVKQRISDVTNAATVQQAIVGRSSEDWIRIERAKNEKLKELNKEMTGEHEMSMASMMRGILRWYAAYYVVSSAIQYIVTEFVGAALKMDRINSTLNTITGSLYGTAEAMVYIRGESKRLGLDMATAALAYSKFAVSARGTTLEGEAARKVFTGVSEAVAAMKMPAAEADGIFLALSQMISKGTVSMEELRRQLGDRLPGAFQMAAKAMGVTTAELNKMVAAGDVQADVLLPKLAEELHKTYGKAAVDAAEKGQAAINRFNNAMFESKAIVGEVIIETMLPAMKSWSEGVEILAKKWQALMNPISTDVLKKRAEILKAEIKGWESYSKSELSKDIGGTEEKIAQLKQQLVLINTTIAKDLAGDFDPKSPLPSKPGPSTAELAALKKAEDIQKQVTEIIRKSQLEREEIGKSAYEKDLLRIESKKQKRIAEGWAGTQVEQAAISERQTALAKFNEWQKKEENKATIAWYDNEQKRLKEIDSIRKKLEEDAIKGDVQALKGDVQALIEYYELRDAERIKDAIAERESIFKAEKDDIARPQKEVDEARRMVTFYNDIRGMEEQYRNAKLNWIEKEAALKKAKGEEEVATLKWIQTQRDMLTRENLRGIEEKFDYDNKYTKDTITNMGKILDAAMSMYEKDSSEYARLAEWKKGIQLAEIAMEVAKNVQLLSFMVAQNAAYSVAMAKKAASLQLTAAEAVLTQGAGDPYTAFARIAAMMAIVAGVLSAVSVVGGFGGGSSAIASGPAYGQNTTVLGGANNQGSESIGNTWKLLEDTYDLQKHTLTGIYENMKQLNANITGIVKQVVLGGIGNTTGGQLSAGTSMGGGAALVAFGLPGLVIDKLFGGKLSEAITNIPFVGNILGSIGSFLMGGSGGSQTLTASGINVQGGAVAPYNEVYTAGVNSSWGFGGSDPYTTRNQGASISALVAFFYGPNGLSTTISTMFRDVAQGLGGDATKAKQVITDAFLNMGDISLLGADTPEKIQTAIMSAVSRVEDIAARSIFGDEFINKYIKTNEAAAETVMRLYIDLKAVTDILEMTNQNAISATVDLSEALITVAGGLDKLTESMQTYYDKFFSDVEKQADLKSSLTTMMIAYGYSLPNQRAGYRSLVESLNLTTEAGQNAYVSLMKMSDSADTYYKYLEEARGRISPEQYSTNLAYQRALAGLPSYADGGSFAGGYRIVGESGPEIEYTGPSRIYSNKDSKSLLNNDALLHEIRELRAELGAGNYQIAANTQKSAKFLQYLEQWNDDGTPPVRS